MTTILASMENSLLVVESTRDGWKVDERLKNCNQISIATDPQNPDRAYCGLLMPDYGKPMMVVKLGKRSR